jgi:hypothetical protein
VSRHEHSDGMPLFVPSQIPLQEYFPDYIDAQAALSEEVEAPKAPPPLAPAS